MKDFIKTIDNDIAKILSNKFDVSDINEIVSTVPPKIELGDIAYPMFIFAKILKKSPNIVAEEVADELKKIGYRCNALGPYINVFFDIKILAEALIPEILENQNYGNSTLLSKDKIMLEFSCPNTNKPLHLGHMRNNSIGESVSRILKACGADVYKVNLINDRGIHICKSMLAYKKFGSGKTPESEYVKSDRFVGDYYVKFDKWSKEDKSADEDARKLLIKWEEQDPETIDLWEKMNKWAIDGIRATYSRCGINFDKFYFESQTYLKGKETILKGVGDGIFYKDTDNSVKIDLSEINLDTKVLLRADGTSLYITQDLGTAIYRYDDWKFNRLIYVVADEQNYHFKVLFYVLKKLGYSWADNLYHLSYGMVNLPEGKMKSREGTVVDADDLLNQLHLMAKDEILDKGREDVIKNLEETSEAIALSALNYFLLSITPTKDMIFNPKESLSFNGNTGPYMQYMGTRITSILKKFELIKTDYKNIKFSPDLLGNLDERLLLKLILDYPKKVEQAGKELNPSVLTGFLYDISKAYSKFYHDNPILNEENRALSYTRVLLSKAVLNVLKHCFFLLGIPYLEQM